MENNPFNNQENNNLDYRLESEEHSLYKNSEEVSKLLAEKENFITEKNRIT
jgi:hypothetical protein